jgi:hypothetical protein
MNQTNQANERKQNISLNSQSESWNIAQMSQTPQILVKMQVNQSNG